MKRPREEHCLALDLGSLSVWCYECDDFITSRTTGSVFEFLESAAEQRRASKSSPRKEPRAESQQVPSGHAGLHNLGNTCYMNAALQVMLNWYPLKWPYTFITMPYSQPIRGYFGECSAFVRAKGNRPLSQAFLDLFDAVQDVGTGERGNQAVSPRTFVREIKAVNPAFEGYTQQDTMDFMRTLWDRLHEELGQDSVAVSDQSANQRRKSNRLASSAGLSYTAYSPRSQSIVSDTFGGILRSRIDCLSCKAVLFSVARSSCMSRCQSRRIRFWTCPCPSSTGPPSPNLASLKGPPPQSRQARMWRGSAAPKAPPSSIWDRSCRQLESLLALQEEVLESRPVWQAFALPSGSRERTGTTASGARQRFRL